MSYWKFSIWIVILSFGLSSCKRLNENSENEEKKNTIHQLEEETNSFPKNVVEPNTTDEIKQKDIIEWIERTKIRTLPYYDSTNFDNRIDFTSLKDDIIYALDLKKIYPYDLEEVESIWLREKVELSSQFYALIFGFYPSEHEIYTTLVTYTKDLKLIDFEVVAYDEIAESCFRTESNFEKSKIKVFNFDYCFDNKKETTTYSIEKSGLIKKL